MKSSIGLFVISSAICTGFVASSVASEALPKPLPCAAAPQGMACIQGGSFLRGADDGPPHAKPQQSVWVQTFFMDINEVTYADFRACIKDGKCKKAGPNYKDFNKPNQPINGISWYDAVNYCNVHGKHLPTEAQWEKAARGTDGRKYPWGNEEANCDRMVYMNEKGRSCGIPQASGHPEKGRPNVIGSKPPGIYGLYDMAGNSWEWVNDWYSKNYEICGADCAGPDPKGPCGGDEKCNVVHRRVVRGGSWYWPAEYATTYYRRSHVPSNSPFHHFGFRCAASVDEAAALVSKK